MQLDALRRKFDDPRATPAEKAELRLLLNIYEPQAYRQVLADELRRRGLELIRLSPRRATWLNATQTPTSQWRPPRR